MENLPKLYYINKKPYNYPSWLNIQSDVIKRVDDYIGGSDLYWSNLTPIKPEGFNFYCKECYSFDVYAQIIKCASNVKNYPHDCAVHNETARKSWEFETSWLIIGFCSNCNKEVEIKNKQPKR